jgi:hypothetical protein
MILAYCISVSSESTYFRDLSSLPPSMFAKKYPRTSGDGQTTSLDSSNRKEVARMEMLIRYLCEEVLADEVANTKTYVEKKLSQSYTEIEAERISEEQALQNPEEESEEEGEEEEKPIYNPKNIPLGWLVTFLFKDIYLFTERL